MRALVHTHNRRHHHTRARAHMCCVGISVIIVARAHAPSRNHRGHHARARMRACGASIALRRIARAHAPTRHNSTADRHRRGEQRRTCADVDASHSLQQRKESHHINKDLLAVKEVIAGITTKHGKLPFRNSSLTRVLQRALLPPDHEGATTIMLATVSPDAASKVSTTNTLRYAQMLTAFAPQCQCQGGAHAQAAPHPWQKTKAKRAQSVDVTVLT
jgi:hypothetical protein